MAISYIAWVFLTLGVGVGALFALWRGPAFLVSARTEWKAGLAAGSLSIVTYGLALWAFRLGATPRLAALREVSILFGVAIAIVISRNGPRPAACSAWPRSGPGLSFCWRAAEGSRFALFPDNRLGDHRNPQLLWRQHP